MVEKSAGLRPAQFFIYFRMFDRGVYLPPPPTEIELRQLIYCENLTSCMNRIFQIREVDKNLYLYSTLDFHACIGLLNIHPPQHIKCLTLFQGPVIFNAGRRGGVYSVGVRKIFSSFCRGMKNFQNILQGYEKFWRFLMKKIIADTFLK